MDRLIFHGFNKPGRHVCLALHSFYLPFQCRSNLSRREYQQLKPLSTSVCCRQKFYILWIQLTTFQIQICIGSEKSRPRDMVCYKSIQRLSRRWYTFLCLDTSYFYFRISALLVTEYNRQYHIQSI